MVGLSALDMDVVPLTKESRSSFLTNSTCCSAMSSSGMDTMLLDSEALSTSRLSSLYGGGDRAGQRLTILEEDLETNVASLSQKQVQNKLFELHSVRVLKQVPLPDWMKIFVPRIVRLQTGTLPYMEYARCEKGEVRQRQMISVWTRVDRLPKNKLSIDFRMPANGERSAPPPSSAASKGTNDKVSHDKWILRFDTKNERDQWAKLVQDAVDLLGWITKFTLGGVIMETQNSSVVECFTWMDRGRPSYVMKSMEASSTKQSHSARNEIEIQRMLTNYSSHPNIVALHDSFRQKEKAYLVMENCVGGDLFDFISQNGGMDEHEAKTLFRHIASAVNHCHEHGIVHLDIKPENLFFKVSALQLETVKLGDFGSAMQLDKSMVKKAISCTVGYAAPEVLQNGKISYAADVFSAGAVLYTILCGYSPFSAPSEDDMLERTLSGEIFFDELEWWRVSKEAQELVKQMMHADADQRPSMEEVLDHPWFSKW
ncbi:hypothetical protein PF005_g22548 [Phytophthora fragariae]|uniref:Protein kinase domain-containing protein n=1 Tax=Phytophthora fragariae TaxID=53985 RepID=A0A6A3T5W4_9STRA|nr:hypothetical protein PF003_g7344 [Phytophthora fragariae]KAE8930291.1 hypothetical protein PF009_g19611 [Phytophthora fragariae]KAE8992417.1 hypothetical protein PF011_g17555 [Phytophthora fragariae]KAE9095935.1 hypothetical protein PF010_g16520 [Phytophthora fragariae]KAE9127471.1 hypothetical protein PF006_g16505 [Phytophthora fragariae]